MTQAHRPESADVARRERVLSKEYTRYSLTKSPMWFFLVLATSIFVFEFLVMALLAALPPLSWRVEAFLDPALLSIPVSITLYFLVYRPSVTYLGERKHLEEQIARISMLKEELLDTASLTDKAKRITDGIVTIFGADFARIWTIDVGDLCDKGCVHAPVTEGPHVCRDRSECLHLLASSGRYTHIDGPHGRVPFGSYKIGRIGSGAEVEFVTNDVVHDPRVHNREWAAELGLVSFGGWRLKSPENKPIGVMALFSKRPILPEEAQLLQDLGNTASLVIRSGTVEQELQHSHDELEARVHRRTQELGQSNAFLRSEIDGRRQMEEALRKAHGEAERLLTTMSSFLIELEQDLRITRWNAAAETTFGTPATSVIGMPFDSCGIRWDWETVVKQLPGWPVIERAIRLPEVRYVRSDGTEGFLSMVVNPIENDLGIPNGCFLLGMDISEHRNLELQLMQAQKLESIGRLASGISHEINTPIQYVGDNIEFLRAACDSLIESVKTFHIVVEAGREGPILPPLLAQAQSLIEGVNLEYLAEQVPRAIEQSLEGIERVATIVQAMKEFSHPGEHHRTNVDLNQCIRSTVIVSRNEWKYVAESELNLDDSLPQVLCLPGEINQALLNIIVNAAHAIGDVVAGGAEERGQITISTRQKDAWAEIRIADTGAGIPKDIRDRIFDPFFTTKEVGKGTGQGLAIAHNIIVNKHGGTLALESEVGTGTTFIIRLPIEGMDSTDEESSLDRQI